MKKIFAIILALAMTFALSATALAEDTYTGNGGSGTITIDNAVIDREYHIYKVFDAEYTTDTNPSTAYYFTPGTDGAAFLTALQGESSPFNVTATSTAGTYNVTIKDGKTGTDVSNFLADNVANLEDLGTKTATATSLVFNNLKPGYYYIKCGTEATATITTAKPDATVHDKNGKPGFEEGGKQALDADGNVITTATIGDTIYYQITAFVPKYNGANPVHTYTFTDNLGAGLTYADNLVVTLKDESTPPQTMTITSSCTVTNPSTENNNTLTILFHPNDSAEDVTPEFSGISGYYTMAHVTITYQAKINGSADDSNLTNEVTLTVDDSPLEDKPGTETEVYGRPIQKFITDTTTMLTGAKFELYKEYNAENNSFTGEIKVRKITGDNPTLPNAPAVPTLPDGMTATYYIVDPEGTDLIEAGYAYIWGLAAGTYHLKEVEAPDGYNLIEGDTEFVIDAPTSTDAHNWVATALPVYNATGGTLPGVGGIGTTIFYIIGGLLMVGAAVLLVVRKKMSVTE